MVKLRLRRKGRKGYPVYDVVAVDSRRKRDGAYIERLGYYDPNTSPNTVKLDDNRAIYWLNEGAQPTLTVKNIFSYEGVLLKRALLFKGLDEDQINEQVTKHKENALARHDRLKKARKARNAKPVVEETAPVEEAAPAEQSSEETTDAPE
ncbi:MAG: 30S ribosomal protein S16 [Candidatus Kapaibacterium sp.]|nr:30S ribosomal protein S16 [Ignavibacteriota bacterium]MCB9220893.1 30S ribosomal protein S16 [Ignavibacteria bacterium]